MNITSMDQASTLTPITDELDPPIDSEVLFSRCLGNVSLAMALIGELESSGSQQVDHLTQSVTDGNVADAAEGAHALKGAAAIIGAQALSAKAAEMELAAGSGQSDQLLNILRDLDEEMTKCLSYIPELRLQKQGS